MFMVTMHVQKRLKMCKSLTPVLWWGAFPQPQHVDTASSPTRPVNYSWENKCVLNRELGHNIILGSVTALILNFSFFIFLGWSWSDGTQENAFFFCFGTFAVKAFFLKYKNIQIVFLPTVLHKIQTVSGKLFFKCTRHYYSHTKNK